MTRRFIAASVGAVVSAVTLRAITRRAAARLLAPPTARQDVPDVARALDALGGEVVRFRARDGLGLAARWLPADSSPALDAWRPDAHDAIVLLHGWSGSSAPVLVEYGPFLRETAGVLGLDFRGHGNSEDGQTTFGLREIEDVAGALSWLGERGIERVALVGMSMGGIAAIAAVVILGDGSLASADTDPAAPAHVAPVRRPRIVAVVADSVAPELAVPIVSRLRGPGRRIVAARLLDAAARTLGADPREIEPRRIVGLLEGTPLVLISGAADTTVPVADSRRLAAAAPPGTVHWVVPGAEHGRAHESDPSGYETRVTDHLRRAFASAGDPGPIIGAPVEGSPDSPEPADVPDPAIPVED